jgi:hypothetical protein
MVAIQTVLSWLGNGVATDSSPERTQGSRQCLRVVRQALKSSAVWR